MVKMGVKVRTGNEDIVQIDENEGKSTEDAVHQTLECLGRILKTKGHSQEFKEPKRRNNGGLRNVCFIHGDLVVSSNQVYHRENCSSSCGSGERLDMWQRIPIIRSGEVEAAVVSAGAPRTVRLRNYVESGEDHADLEGRMIPISNIF